MGGLTLSADEPTEQTLRVEEAIRHEGYRETSKAVYNDIGDLLLKNALNIRVYHPTLIGNITVFRLAETQWEQWSVRK